MDTSSGTWPSNDWQITFNDSANGGANRFSIEDPEANTIPFTIEAGAFSHSLYVDQVGQLGLGTSIPSADVHLLSIHSPRIRLEQEDGLFSGQTWDIVGSDLGFRIHDGAIWPFSISPGTPQNSLVIQSRQVVINQTGVDFDTRIEGNQEENLFFVDASEGRVGIGLSNPQRDLHLHEINNSNEAVMLLTTDNTGSTASDGLYLGLREDTAWLWNFENSQLVLGTNGVTAVTIQPSGDMTVEGDVTANGVLLTSSRTLKRDIKPVSSTDALLALKQLEPVEYRFKRTPEEEHIGFIAEEMPDLLATNDRKTIAPPEILAVVTKVVKAQQQTIATQQQKIEAQQYRLERQYQMMAKLTERMDHLEGQLTSNDVIAEPTR